VSAGVSACCGAGLRVAGRTTNYYLCQGCGKPCDAVPRVPVHPADEAEDVR
jgi:hypothetical protein